MAKEGKKPGSKKGKGGRLPSLTPEVHKLLVQATSEGLPRKTVAAVAGIGLSTFMSYLAKGRKQKKGMYRELSDAVKGARGSAVRRNVLVIQNAAMGKAVAERRTIKHKDGSTEVIEKFAPAQWTAAAWWLERCESDEFGRKDQTTLKADPKDKNAHGPLVIIRGPARVKPPTVGADEAPLDGKS